MLASVLFAVAATASLFIPSDACAVEIQVFVADAWRRLTKLKGVQMNTPALCMCALMVSFHISIAPTPHTDPLPCASQTLH